MGQQITFHMLEEDRAEFFSFLGSRHPFVAAKWTSDTQDIVYCKSPAEEQSSLGLWEPLAVLPRRERKRIERADGSIAYDLDRRTSILEFDPGMIVTHNTAPGLLQGRLYSFLKEMDPGTSGLFQTAKQWIKQSFEPSPLTLLGGYLGPSALSWYRKGGILLPMFNPPSTPPWEDFIVKQHPQSVA